MSTSAALPANEEARLALLHRMKVLDTLPETDYHDLVTLAAHICNAPVAFISLVDAQRQWLKAHIGLESNESSRDDAFCAHAILQPGQVMVVPDATLDSRFAANPFVTAGPELRFYAGVPVVSGDDLALGTICVMDKRPRDGIRASEERALHSLSRQVGNLLDLRLYRILLEEANARSEQLLLNVLPKPVADRLKETPEAIADVYAGATVLFADIVDFSALSATLSAKKLVALLNDVFTEFDRLADRYGLEKIKTIGDCYMVAGGLPEARPDHAWAVAAMALEMRDAVRQFVRSDGYPIRLRIGIHSGPVIAGVIGARKFSYDLWGDTVNVASRMESQGEADSIQVTEETYRYLQGAFTFSGPRRLEVKGRGEMDVWRLEGRNNA